MEQSSQQSRQLPHPKYLYFGLEQEVKLCQFLAMTPKAKIRQPAKFYPSLEELQMLFATIPNTIIGVLSKDYYLHFDEEYQEKSQESGMKIITIDASKSIDEVFADIIDHLK